MAKKGARINAVMQCSECKSQNYTQSRNTTNIKDKLEMNKFCPKCRKHTLHRETKA